jgi:hypothetical protein
VCEIGSYGSGQSLMAGLDEPANELSGSINSWKLLDRLCDCQLLQGCASRSYSFTAVLFNLFFYVRVPPDVISLQPKKTCSSKHYC